MAQAARIATKSAPADQPASQLDADGAKSISKRLTFLLYRAVSALVDATAPEYRQFGLSIPAARTLVSLLESGGSATVGNLSDTTCIDLSTMSHNLRRLESLKYLKRQRQTDDNRVVVAVLTKLGTDVARTCRNKSIGHEAVLVRGMSDLEISELKSALNLVYKNAREGL